MAAHVALLRPDDSQQPVIVAPAPRPLPRACTWTTLLDSFPDDSSFSSRVEPRAFSEDACSLLSAGTWPPRSYSCSFCRREFRSAQALGGHMNVHRRDRARLRQSSPSATDSASLALAPDLLHSDIAQAADQPSMSFAYPAPNVAKMSSSLAASSSVGLSPPSSKPLFISSPAGVASSTSLYRISFQDFPPHASSLPVFPSRSSRLTSQFASPSLNSLRPTFHNTGVVSFSGQGSNPGTLFDTGKRHGVSTSLPQLKSESSRIKAFTPGGFHPYHSVSGKILDSVHLLRPRSVDKENDNVTPDGLDLELRLGQKS